MQVIFRYLDSEFKILTLESAAVFTSPLQNEISPISEWKEEEDERS